jgi:hypothetical protein
VVQPKPASHTPAARPPHAATVVQPKAPHPATVAQSKAQHPATVAQPKMPHPATIVPGRGLMPPTPPRQPVPSRPPHPATVVQPKAPHPVTVAQPKRPFGGVAGKALPPHPATVQSKSTVAGRPSGGRLSRHDTRMIIQRDTVINWDEYPYDPDDVIDSVRYTRSGSAGGNHFVPNKWIADTIINIIWKLKRKDAIPTLENMTKTVLESKIAAGDFKSLRDFDNFVDYSINGISDHDCNRWSGVSNGDGGGTKLDPPKNSYDIKFAKAYGQRLVKAIEAAYTAQGLQPESNAAPMLEKIKSYIK